MPCPQCRLPRAHVPRLFTGAQRGPGAGPLPSLLTTWSAQAHLIDYSPPGSPVLHYLPEFAQTHVRCVNDAIQPSHPLLPPSPALNLSEHQGLFH